MRREFHVDFGFACLESKISIVFAYGFQFVYQNFGSHLVSKLLFAWGKRDKDSHLCNCTMQGRGKAQWVVWFWNQNANLFHYDSHFGD